MKCLTVKTSENYPVIITDGFNEFSRFVLNKLSCVHNVMCVSDSNVFPLYGKALKSVLSEYGKRTFNFVIEAGEASKSIDNYVKLINYLAQSGFCKNDAIIALGGGVTGDLAGFAASTYMRGIKLVFLPTTVLSFVDSSVGGKTAVNLPQGKNMAGTIYQPNAVYINYALADTLPEREKKSGLGEIIKYTYLTEKVTRAEALCALNENLIYKCLKCKAEIVEKDERDCGTRKLLNFGHTFGHAVEKLSGYKISHGEGVVKGIYLSMLVSEKLFNLSGDLISKQRDFFRKAGFDLSVCYTKEQMFSALKTDKKGDGNCVDYVLLDSRLKPTVKNIPISELVEIVYERKNIT